MFCLEKLHKIGHFPGKKVHIFSQQQHPHLESILQLWSSNTIPLWKFLKFFEGSAFLFPMQSQVCWNSLIPWRPITAGAFDDVIFPILLLNHSELLWATGRPTSVTFYLFWHTCIESQMQTQLLSTDTFSFSLAELRFKISDTTLGHLDEAKSSHSLVTRSLSTAGSPFGLEV